jgi:hypothetical protein
LKWRRTCLWLLLECFDFVPSRICLGIMRRRWFDPLGLPCRMDRRRSLWNAEWVWKQFEWLHWSGCVLLLLLLCLIQVSVQVFYNFAYINIHYFISLRSFFFVVVRPDNCASSAFN